MARQTAYSPITGNTFPSSYGALKVGKNLADSTSALMQAQLSKEMYDYQFEKENAYNDPSAQMARLQAAGLNPHLVYANGVDNSSASPGMSAPSVGAHSAQETGMYMQQTQNAISNLLQVSQMQQQHELNEASIKQMNANAAMLQGRAYLLNDEHLLNMENLLSKRRDNNFGDITFGARVRGVDLDVEGKDLNNNQTFANIWKTLAEIGLIGDQRDLNKFEKDIKKYFADQANQGHNPNATVKDKLIEDFVNLLKDYWKEVHGESSPYINEDAGETPTNYDPLEDKRAKKYKEEDKNKLFKRVDRGKPWLHF